MLAERVWGQYRSSSRELPAVGRPYGRVSGSADISVIPMRSEGHRNKNKSCSYEFLREYNIKIMNIYRNARRDCINTSVRKSTQEFYLKAWM
jgi:hypothetical protein